MHRHPLLRLAEALLVAVLLLLVVVSILRIRGAFANPGLDLDRIFADGFEQACINDFDGDGICDEQDHDDDGDGIPDEHDDCPLDPDNGCGAVDPCSDPRVNPAGMTGVDRTWQVTWSATNGSPLYQAQFPNSPPAPIALGANVGTYKSVGYIYPPNLTWVVSWDPAQPNGAYGYGQPRVTTGGMFIGFSPCRGDFRKTDQTSGYWWLRSACRKFNTAGSITLTTRTDLPAHICYVPAGVAWYMTVSSVNPADDVLTDTCSPPTFTALGLGCDVQATHRQQ